MKYLFFVQGEGRGHLNQALTLKEKLENHGHQICGIVIGKKPKNKIPDFFKKEIKIPLFKIASPGFAVDKKEKGVKLSSSIIQSFYYLPIYLKSLKKIKKIIKNLNPDILVNFYEPLANNYYRFYHDHRPLFCLGHQYFIEHSSFKFPNRQYLNRWSFLFYTNLNAPKKATKIALSFTPEKDQTQKKLFICPPLIRKEIKKLSPKNENFLLLYILNPGYSQEIINWNKKNPQIRIEVFWNPKKEANKTINSTLNFNKLSGKKFINYLSTCKSYASSAGFDSICEAAYLQKNILMVPTKNHFEQKCNALDAQRAGIALSAKSFDLNLITKKSNQNSRALKNFKNWVDNYDDKIIKILESNS